MAETGQEPDDPQTGTADTGQEPEGPQTGNGGRPSSVIAERTAEQ